MDFSFNSVVDVPQLKARAIFVTDTTTLFKEDGEISPIQLDENTSYIPWGADNLLPYNVLKKIEADETLATCQSWNAEVCYGQGLKYDTCVCSDKVKQEVDDFFFENGMQSFFLGSCLDFKHFGFCVTLIILSKDGFNGVPANFNLWGEEEQRSASARKARPLSAVCDDELHGCRS